MDVAIGRCTADEIDDVVRFIDEHWKRGHILTTCRPLLDWQYRDSDGRGYAFIVARRSDSSVLGILGYIATRRFDPSLAVANVVWLTTWKVRDDAGVSGLGIQLLQYLSRVEPYQAIGAVGLTPSTLPIYKALGYTMGELHHYVRPNASAPGSAIASIDVRGRPNPPSEPGYVSTRLVTDDDFRSLPSSSVAVAVPFKSPEYFRQRYAHHPVYRYIVGAISGPAGAGLLTARLAEHAGCRALRVVDFAGPPETLATTGRFVDSLLEEFQAEYADVYNAGIPEDVFVRAGFSKVDPEGTDIVPDHFEPYERRNVRLWYAMKGAASPVVFKGDGDQDRPNQLPGVSR